MCCKQPEGSSNLWTAWTTAGSMAVTFLALFFFRVECVLPTFFCNGVHSVPRHVVICNFVPYRIGIVGLALIGAHHCEKQVVNSTKTLGATERVKTAANQCERTWRLHQFEGITVIGNLFCTGVEAWPCLCDLLVSFLETCPSSEQ